MECLVLVWIYLYSCEFELVYCWWFNSLLLCGFVIVLLLGLFCLVWMFIGLV